MDEANQQTALYSSEEISIKEFIHKVNKVWYFLLSKWRVILISGVIGAGVGLTYAIRSSAVYKAEFSFALDDDRSSSGGLGAAMGLASQFGLDLGNGNAGGAFSGDNLLELMKSRSMVEASLLTEVNVKGKKQTLAELYIDFNKIREQWKDKQLNNIHFLAGINRSEFTLQQDSVLAILYKNVVTDNLSVARLNNKVSIISIIVNSKNELFSKYFAEVLSKTVSDFYINTKTKKAVQNVAILQRQTDSVRRELNIALAGVASSVDINPNANPALQILRVPSQRRQVDVQANQAILTQLVANLEMSKISLRKETPLIQVIDKPILPLPKEKVGKLKGIILGGVILGFLATLIILIRKMFKIMLS
jgi:hypothetical protein